MRTFETVLGHVGLAILAGLSLADDGQAAAPVSQKAFVQIEDVALVAGDSAQKVWLRVADQSAGVDAACASDGSSWFFAAGPQEELQTVRSLATTGKTARFRLLVEYTVRDVVSQYSGHGSTRCELSRLSLGD